MADDTPEFGRAPSFISDVQISHDVTEDKKVLQIFFDNFDAVLVPRGSPIATRTFSIVLPIKNMKAGARLTGGVSGTAKMTPGTAGTLIFRAAGISQAFDQLVDQGKEEGFMKELNLPVPAGEDLRITIIIALEASSTDPNAEALVIVSAVDLQLGPGEPELQT